MAAKSPATNGKPAVATNGHSTKSAENEWKTKKVFAKAGFKDPQPNVNILTFNRWIAKGFRPVEGSKSLKVNNLRLFHVSQVRPLSKEEIKAMKAQSEAADKRQKSANVTELHPAQ